MKFNFKIIIVLLLLHIVAVSDVLAYENTNFWVSKFDDFAEKEVYITIKDKDGKAMELSAFSYWELLSKRGAVHYINKYYIENTFEDLSIGLNALLGIYEATGDEKYFKRLLYYCNNLIDSAHQLSSKEIEAGYKSGENFRGFYQENEGYPNITEEIKPFRYVLKFCRVIMQTPVLKENYKIFVDKNVKYIEYNLWKKWSIYDGASGFRAACLFNLKQATAHIGSNFAFIADDLLFLKTNYGIGTNENKNEYKEIIAWFHDNLGLVFDEKDTTCYFYVLMDNFGYKKKFFCSLRSKSTYNDPDECESQFDDVSHANFVVSYMIESFELHPKQPYTMEKHMNGLINTFTKRLWKGCNGPLTNNARMSEIVDGSYTKICLCCRGTSIENSGYDIGEGWAKLGRFSPVMQDAMERFINCKIDGQYPYQYYNSSRIGLYAQMALNAKYLEKK